MEPARIVVVGSSNTDFVMRVPQLPEKGETILGTGLSIGGGGKGANQAVAAARLGAQVTFVAKLGDDTNGQRALSSYKDEGVDTRHILWDLEEPSGIAMILVDSSGENMIAVAPGANRRLMPADIASAEEAIKNSDCLLIQLEVPIDTVAEAVSVARRHAVRVVLNPAPATRLNRSVLGMVDVLTPNMSEAAGLSGQAVTGPGDAARAARQLANQGSTAVVITLGAQGALAYNRGEATWVPAYRVEEVDSTAAGDAFSAALAVALARGLSLLDSARYANAVGGLTVTKPGAMASLPREPEVRAFLASSGPQPEPVQIR
jgi:ribokinase